MFPARHKHAKLRIKSDNIVRVVLETFKKGGFSTKKRTAKAVLFLVQANP